jgi:ABC-type cobalamin/Fe3+-siderophores transport system ATPase subunit
MHDINLTAMFSDMVLMLKNRRLVQTGRTSHVIHEENLKEVFGVETVVHRSDQGVYVRTLKPIEPGT